MRSLAFLAAAAALALSGAASAANITLNETIDLGVPPETGGFTTWRDFASSGGAFSPDFSFDLSAGDSLDFTAMFAPGQSLTLTNPSTVWLASFSTQGAPTDVDATGSLELLDTTGAVLFTSNVKTDEEGSVHFGQFFSPSDFAGLPSTVTFGGMRYQGTLNFYIANNPGETPGVTTRTYADPFLAIAADAVTPNGIGAAPEPAAWALMLGGFGLAGATLRMRRALRAA